MAKKIGPALYLLCAALLLSGCKTGTGGVFGILNGFLAWTRQDWDLSVATFIGTAGEAAAEQAGIIAYRKGQFDQAASFFRKSLENDPSGVDAKINLELSRRSLEEKEASLSGGASGIREEKAPGQDSDTIFNLVRKKEQDRWKNQDEISSGPATADY